VFNKTLHQKKQIQIIEQIVESAQLGKISVVAPVKDFAKDPRLCLTFAHFPDRRFVDGIKKQILDPLKIKFPEFYFYEPNSLHMTIKNVRTIEKPPNFTVQDVKKARKAGDSTIPFSTAFKTYFYRLILFPNSISLVGTTEPALDTLFHSLDSELNKIGVPDNKVYANTKNFFTNITIARFNEKPGTTAEAIENLNKKIQPSPYEVTSVSLVKANAAMLKRSTVKMWKLKTKVLTSSTRAHNDYSKGSN